LLYLFTLHFMALQRGKKQHRL